MIVYRKPADAISKHFQENRKKERRRMIKHGQARTKREGRVLGSQMRREETGRKGKKGGRKEGNT